MTNLSENWMSDDFDNPNQPDLYDAVLGGQSPPATLLDILRTLEELKSRTSWKLLYAHDQAGNCTAGDIQLLIKAIQNGHQVRLVSCSQEDFNYAIDAEILWIRNNIVYAQNSSHISASFHGNRLMFHQDSYHFITISSTKGDREIIRWNIGEHKKQGGIEYKKVAIKWFADVG
ncbi:MAG: hypothetical protein F6J86_14695 [Symploca sp. SIO1B1]|nr:hypothetical protein [Symploca sp. SIO1B1]